LKQGVESGNTTLVVSDASTIRPSDILDSSLDGFTFVMGSLVEPHVSPTVLAERTTIDALILLAVVAGIVHTSMYAG